MQLIERAEVIKNYREFLEFEKSSYSLLLYSSPSSRPIPFMEGGGGGKERKLSESLPLKAGVRQVGTNNSFG